MALSKPVLEIMNETSLAATATVPAIMGGTECSIIDTTEVTQLSLELEAVFNADATGDCVFHIRTSSSGGTLVEEWDTEDYSSATLTVVQGERVQKTISLDPAPKYLQVFAVNADGTYSMTSVKVTRATQEIQTV